MEKFQYKNLRTQEIKDRRIELAENTETGDVIQIIIDGQIRTTTTAIIELGNDGKKYLRLSNRQTYKPI